MAFNSETIILASTSPFRRKMLEDVGLDIATQAPDIDERSVEAPLQESGATAEDVAAILAEAKALDVSERHPNAWVIGADQTLSLEERLFHKPKDMEEARRNLLALSGRTHQLNSGIVLAHQGRVEWRHTAIAHITLRDLDPGFIGRYLAEIGDAALKSVGSYQVEGAGNHLFRKIEGDHFTIIGMPLLPLLEALRERKLIDG
ncbi:Maf-like protein [Nitratireductor basaltis]|uniref:7-methyl-GTP pyrophosphatase n=1 Tax=Nitratireductor basaltis TaxID=472175 RepID=A0A084U6C5_9HYPH|nr:Maf-like protein [Nitratireductor basaltis]KFB08511.1 Maf-like protein [Nitratireductor basaltis]